ncbi:hypothetical protein C8R21_11477 [Nitrosospira multiformis]|uniref:DUF4145 domain-containing protein n=1 Tax=Nitrosospira multiformis TaxID=1231 RepID=A0A2T5IA90_9PROT|nr:hypothetical protein [Nitrosospira multiformis]PTQ80730.1 hypothetical protein C8R21_11477 [Nitrosospira multiformis]
MRTNIERFKKDLSKLIDDGHLLQMAIQHECLPTELEAVVRESLGEKTEEYIKNLPSFKAEYQTWYSKSISLLRQLLPDRLEDFKRHYEKPKSRREITVESYRIEDYLQGISITRRLEGITVVGLEAAIPHFNQQIAIIKAASARFDSSLFEIRQLVQADLFDTELEAAESLLKYKFTRAAGALAGVVLEGHLSQICSDRLLTPPKKNPGISDFNDILKSAEAIDIPQWRFIQHLADIRNLCDHSRKPEPTEQQVKDLIDGVKKIIKTVF